mgnify:CR=1 FL=1
MAQEIIYNYRRNRLVDIGLHILAYLLCHKKQRSQQHCESVRMIK